MAASGPGGWSEATGRASGGFRNLHTFHLATLIYDATVEFCDRWIDKKSRTHDQMVQAARSGRQNIAEGSRAAATSSQTEIRLTGVARASLDELLLDFQDFLRQRGSRRWRPDEPEALAVRSTRWQRCGERADDGDRFGPYAKWLSSADPVVCANAIICLIHQASFLLDRLIRALEADFVRSGGYTERLAAARISQRDSDQAALAGRPESSSKRGGSAAADAMPRCPACGSAMALRTARKGPSAGSQFWGCSMYPACRATLPMEGRPSER